MPYHEVKDPFETAQQVIFEQLRKAGAEKRRQEREEERYQSTQDYLREQVNNYNNGVDPADNESGYGTEKTNKDVQDSMNEKLNDKGISVDNVDTKHVSDDTQEMTLANRPTTDDKVKESMNDKLADKGITVDNVNTDPVSNAEHVTMDRTQSKTKDTGTGTVTTSGQDDNKLSTKPKASDSPLGDMETMSKMKTSTSSSTVSTNPGAPSAGGDAPKSNVRTTNESSASSETKPANVTLPNAPKDVDTKKMTVGESFKGTKKTTELPKNNVNADKAGLIGLKSSKSLRK